MDIIETYFIFRLIAGAIGLTLSRLTLSIIILLTLGVVTLKKRHKE